MGDMEVSMECERCHDKLMIDVDFFEQLQESAAPFYCKACLGIIEDEEFESDEPPKRCFEYMVAFLPDLETDTTISDYFKLAGQHGWELITVDNATAYFKKEYLQEQNDDN